MVNYDQPKTLKSTRIVNFIIRSPLSSGLGAVLPGECNEYPGNSAEAADDLNLDIVKSSASGRMLLGS